MDLTFEAGLQQAWYTFEYSDHFPHFSKEEKEKKILYFFDLIPFFIILVVGYVLAFVVFLIEKSRSRHSKKLALISVQKRIRAHRSR